MSAAMVGESRTRQVRALLERRITSGALGPAGRLPSTRTLAEELAVSRSTVQAALDMLVAEGYVETRPRSGLFAGRHVRDRPQGPGGPGAADTWWERRLGPRTRDVGRAPERWWEVRYPFVTGQVDRTLFPLAPWVRALRRAHEREHVDWCSSEHGGDDPLLVEQLCEQLLPPRGIDAAPADVVITLGSQQALGILADLVVRPGHRVAVEDPGYPDARTIMTAAGADVVPVPVDGDGMRTDRIEGPADLVYVTPSHQHPTNVTMSLERRVRLLDLAAERDAVIVEDDYDSELRYHGAPSPSLASLDRSGRTIYLGTFSKFVAPGLRVGFLVGPTPVAAAVRDRVRLAVRQVPGPLQRAMALFVQSGDYARALARQRRELHRRWSVAREAAVEHLPCHPDFPPGGGSLWLRTYDGTDWHDVADRARRRGVLLQPPDQHWAYPARPFGHLRLGFTAIPADRIRAGMAEVGAAFREARGT